MLMVERVVLACRPAPHAGVQSPGLYILFHIVSFIFKHILDTHVEVSRLGYKIRQGVFPFIRIRNGREKMVCDLFQVFRLLHQKYVVPALHTASSFPFLAPERKLLLCSMR